MSVSRFYLLTAIVAGLFFAVFVPPSQVLDESAHFFRVWQITEGNVVADTRTDQWGEEVPGGTYDVCVREYVDEFFELAQTPASYDWSDFWVDTPRCGENDVEIVGEPMGTYSVWSYPGHSLGVAVGRLLHLPLPVTFYLGRLLGMAATIAMCWWAIRVTPRAKLVFAFVALLPMSLIGMSGFSPDGMVLGCSLILTAYAIRFAEQRSRERELPSQPPSRIDIAVIVAALTALVASKPPYVVFALLFLTYRADLFGTRRATAIRLGAMAAGPVLFAALWAMVGYPPGALVATAGTDQGAQLSWLLRNPLEYLNVLADTVFSPESQEFVMKGWVGAFGMFRSGIASTPLMLTTFVVIAALSLGALVAAEAGPRIAFASRRVALQTWVPLAVCLLGVLAVYTSAYLSWTPVAAARVTGVQGRYLISLIALPVATVALRHRRSDAAVGLRFTAVAVAILFAASVVKVVAYFY